MSHTDDVLIILRMLRNNLHTLVETHETMVMRLAGLITHIDTLIDYLSTGIKLE